VKWIGWEPRDGEGKFMGGIEFLMEFGVRGRLRLKGKLMLTCSQVLFELEIAAIPVGN
jgi:hypothetical protein